mgnify:CR=1 FL=1
MKKIIIALSLVLGVGGISALQAQMRIFNSNLVKFGNVNTSPTLSSGLEIAMPNFLFKGSSVKFTVGGATLEFKGRNVANAAPAANGDWGTIDPIPVNTSLTILGPKNDVTIGATDYPLNTLYTTTIYRKSEQTLSDRRYKTNIKNLDAASDKIMRLRPVKFDYLEEKNDINTLDSAHRDNLGLIAQELLEVVPEAVRHLLPEDVYTIDYTMLIPVLIKAVQEQQAQIAPLREEVEVQRDLIDELQLQIEALQALVVAQNADPSIPDATVNSTRPKDTPAETVKAAEANRLWSNVPNPFKQETRIRYALNEDVRDAQLCIYDLSGKQLACHRLNDRGESEFTLRAASLMPGIYLYSLIADGKVVDTHRMVVTE